MDLELAIEYLYQDAFDYGWEEGKRPFLEDAQIVWTHVIQLACFPE